MPSLATSPSRQQPLAAIVDAAAKENPEKVILTIAKSLTSTDGATHVTWRQIARAVDRAARWLDRTVGEAEGFPTVGFMSANYDFRYFIFMLAGIKTGHKIFLPSPRNSEEFHTHLINKLSVKTIVSSIPVGPYAEKLGCTVVEPPSLSDLIADGEVEPYAYNKTLDEARDDYITVLHSSGSTGPPKPILFTNGYMEATRKVVVAAKSAALFDRMTEDRVTLSTMPLFHTAGLMVMIIATIYLDSPMLLTPADAIINTRNVASIIDTFNPIQGTVPPSVLEDFASEDQLIPSLAKMEVAWFGGAALAEEAGEKLGKHICLESFIGSTEASYYPVLQAQPGWQAYSWFHFETIPGFTFRREEDGLYELVYERTDAFDHAIFHTFPDKNEYATSDLYEKHPDLPNTWHWYGRKDDVLVLSNGEKVVPPPMEGMLRMPAEVSGALYVGRGKFTVGVLIEKDEDATDGLSDDEVLDRIRPWAVKANNMAPAFARLTRDMVIFTSKEKPMKRAAKGSVLRRATIAEYDDEIEALYQKADAAAAVPLVKNLSEEATKQALVTIFEKLAGKQIAADEELFSSAGVDSMQVIAATRAIKASVEAEAPEYAKKVTASIVYANSTIEQLTGAIRSLVLTGNPEAVHRDAAGEVAAMISKYSEGIPEAVPYVHNGSDKTNVVLTGTTGSLGSYMLSLLINDPHVGKIFALNRSENAVDRQQTANAARGLSTDFSKVTFLKSSFGSKNLGLEVVDYQTLVSEANLIVHNAWPVNFNNPLDSFEPQVRGVRSFIDLAAASSLRPHIVFTSSIGVFGAWDAIFPGQPRPEKVFDNSLPCQPGYGESKFVGEHLLTRAAARGVCSTVARVGQIAGPVESVKGEWNRQEWLPSIVFSSAKMGLIPADLGNAPLNWIPVDSMAKIVLDLGFEGMGKDEATNKASGSENCFNLVNPAVRPWSDLVPVLKERLPGVNKVVSWAEWYNQLRADSENNATDASQHPAVKLVDFYEDLGIEIEVTPGGFDTDKVVAASKTAANVRPVNSEWMGTWLTQWGF